MEYFISKRMGGLYTVLLCIILSYSFIGQNLVSPNRHMYTFGGDGLTIYYDMTYHICHGKGQNFSGMNYPDGELIYMTDAQAILSITLSWINEHLFSVCEYTVGIINFLIAFSVILCSLVLYYLLTMLKVRMWIAVIFSTLITLLSPQIFRIVAHFGLAYLFLIPLCFTWIVQKQRDLRFRYYDVLMGIMILLMTLNNPYLGFIGGATIIFSGLYLWIRSHFRSNYLYLMSIGLIPLVIAFTYLKFFDKVPDRIQLQWGYFSLQASPKGILAPKGSLADDVLKFFGKPSYELDFESIANLGLVSVFALILIIVGLFLKKKYVLHFSVPKEFRPIVFASLVLLVYSTGLLFLPFEQDYTENKLGFLLMFKAVGRLVWPLYYTISILTVLYLNGIIQRTNKILGYVIAIAAAIIWKWEINTYVIFTFKDKMNDNLMSSVQAEYYKNVFSESNINPNDFQAILSLPKLMTWHDNFISEVNWSTQFNSMNISRTTGLPMINAMLSRISTSQAAERIQILANPLIYKPFIDKLPSKKDILIVLAGDPPALSIGEKFLIDVSDTLYYKEHEYSLHRLKLDSVNNNKYLKSAQVLSCNSGNDLTGSIYLGFNETTTDTSYFGTGAKKYGKGRHNILETKIENPLAEHYVFSIWTRFDHLKYGIGWVNCQVTDSLGNVIYNETPDTRRSNDIHGSWIRTEQWIPTPKNCTIKVDFDTNRDLYIDELLIRPKSKDVLVCDQKSGLLLNGFRIEVR